MSPEKLLFICALFLSSLSGNLSNALEEKNCPVCFAIVNKLRDDVTKDGAKATIDNISESFLHLCDLSKKGSAEDKFCYYLGGQDESATRTYKQMAQQMVAGLPTHRVCEELQKKDSQICEIREKKPIDLATVDLKSLKIAELKRILKERGVVCDGCLEKSEFIRKVEEIKKREDL